MGCREYRTRYLHPSRQPRCPSDPGFGSHVYKCDPQEEGANVCSIETTKWAIMFSLFCLERLW